jgi:uncharacterized protein YbgA (DUF1722 family)/uncharacterized protein YbbK (DUF523 family)
MSKGIHHERSELRERSMKASHDIKPIVVVSKCLGFARCRYNGITIDDDFVTYLKPYVQYQPVCPEVEIGLGVPRNPIRVVRKQNLHRLMQPATGLDHTDTMRDFCSAFLERLTDVDGFFLKSRSPSCGIKDVKIFASIEKSPGIGKDAGFFGKAVMERFPHLPVEDEGRIRNFRIREHFLTKLFTFARFRMLEKTMRGLVAFHSAHKLLLMAYHQAELRACGRVVANPEHLPVQDVFARYRDHLQRAFATLPRYTSNINVLMHALGYFKKELSSKEKSFLLESLERYRAGKIPLSVNLGIVRSWIVRFGEEYLEQQLFFEPYPEGLVEITDSGQGRTLRK